MFMRWIGWSLLCLLALVACGEAESEPAASQPTAPARNATAAPSDGDVLAQARAEREATAKSAAPTPAVVPDGDYQPLTWAQLADVEFEETYYEDVDEWLWYPSFGPQVQAKTGQPVYIAGYVIPIEPGRYVLSRNPFESCFFCGGAGPETVMDLELVEPDQLFANDDYRTFQGTLRVNDSDIDRLNYILEGAELVEP